MTDLTSGAAPRVRFAPSPTGYLHVGSARTALFNWLFAKRHGGTFVLRIEDTDEERSRHEWTDGIISGLEWLGMAPDEGPYIQSEQDVAHQAAIEALWSAGRLYACDCTREEIEERGRLRAAAGDPTPGYDGHCRDRALPRGEGRALRFRTEDDGSTIVSDVIRGDVDFPNRTTEDFVCVRGNGRPLFVLANVVDDRTTAISHVIRGVDLLPSTPKAIMLWRALDAAAGTLTPLPVFAHLPLLVNEQGKKLSKRRDPVAMELYREQGYLPEAFRNYLALLGWSPGDEEIVPVETLVQKFRLEDVQRSPAHLDMPKLKHMSGVYIRALPVEQFVRAAAPWVAPDPAQWVPGKWHDPDEATSDEWRPPWRPERFDAAAFAHMAPLVQERVTTLSEVPAYVDFLFLDEPPLEEESWSKVFGADAAAATILRDALDRFESCRWDKDTLHQETLIIAETVGWKLGKATGPIRVAVTGRRVGPPLFESLEVLGRDETRRRLEEALTRLAAHA